MYRVTSNVYLSSKWVMTNSLDIIVLSARAHTHTYTQKHRRSISIYIYTWQYVGFIFLHISNQKAGDGDAASQEQATPNSEKNRFIFVWVSDWKEYLIYNVDYLDLDEYMYVFPQDLICTTTFHVSICGYIYLSSFVKLLFGFLSFLSYHYPYQSHTILSKMYILTYWKATWQTSKATAASS